VIPFSWASVPDWMRQVATQVNPIISGYPFPAYSSAPANPNAGFTYFDTTLTKVRTWDGLAWNNHW
jgi:hypothetical protein